MTLHQRQSSPPDEADLEITAELPVLDVAAYEAGTSSTATSVVPAPAEAANAPHGAEHPADSTDSWTIPAPSLRVSKTSSDAANTVIDENRARLEVNLQALGATLREVEERLTRKGERLAEIEKALQKANADRDALELRAQILSRDMEESLAAAAASQARIADLERALKDQEVATESGHLRESELRTQLAQVQALHQSQIAGFQREFEAKLAQHDQMTARVARDLEDARERAAEYLETLQSHEGRRSVFEDLILTLGDDVDTRDSSISRLQTENTTYVGRIRELEAELRERIARISALEKQVNALSAALAQRTEQHTETERASESLQQTLNALNGTLSERNERIRSLETTIGQLNSSAAQLHGQIERATAERIQLVAAAGSLEESLKAAIARGDQHEAAARAAQARVEELEAAVPAQRRRIEQLESEMAVVRGELQASNASLQTSGAERAEHVARISAADSRIAELEARIAEQQETVRGLQAESNSNLARVKELESDLHAAEDSIQALESDSRSKGARVDELEKINQEWRTTVEEARHAIADRDSLIERLEQETAASAVLVGHIQRSITRLDKSAATTNGAGGSGAPSGTNGSGNGAAHSSDHGHSHSHEPAPDGATRLLIRTDGDTEVVHVLGRKTTVGRTPDNDLQIDAKFISRHHAVILAGPAHAIIEDLNSTNGVMVNSRRITRQPLKDGDVVMIGKTQFRFVVRPARVSS